MASKHKGRSRGRGGSRRRNNPEENPSGLSTGLIALGAGVAAVAVTTLVMMSRRDMAMNACSALGQLGGTTVEPTLFARRPNPGPIAGSVHRPGRPRAHAHAVPAAGYGQPRYTHGGA